MLKSGMKKQRRLPAQKDYMKYKKQITMKTKERDNMPTIFPNDGKVHIKWAEDLIEVKNFKKNSAIDYFETPKQVAPVSILKVKTIRAVSCKKKVRYHAEGSDTEASSGHEDAEIWRPNQSLFNRKPVNRAKEMHKPRARRAKSTHASVSKIEELMLAKLQRRYGIPITVLQ